jgi:hypothetical protein
LLLSVDIHLTACYNHIHDATILQDLVTFRAIIRFTLLYAKNRLGLKIFVNRKKILDITGIAVAALAGGSYLLSDKNNFTGADM